jgi:hypothetical protein
MALLPPAAPCPCASFSRSVFHSSDVYTSEGDDSAAGIDSVAHDDALPVLFQPPLEGGPGVAVSAAAARARAADSAPALAATAASVVAAGEEADEEGVDVLQSE